jgi:very-short-patch-repair endonuclease
VRASHLPASGVTRLSGATSGAIALLLDESRESDIAVVTVPLFPANSVLGITMPAVDALTVIAHTLFPRWLPNVGGASALDEAAARIAARRLAREPGVGSALADLATTAMGRGPSLVAVRPLRDRMTAAAAAIRRSYDATALAIACHVPPGCDGRALEHAAEWLADCGVAVWLYGSGSEPADRFPTVPIPTVPITSPPLSGESAPSLPPLFPPLPQPELTFPPLSGLPNPRSAAEQHLEAALQTQEWAADRRWNNRVTIGSAHQPVFVDILFPEARLVVEVDGDDHRTPEKYAADRRRDAALLTCGYRVVRFINADVLTDVSAVLAIMRLLVTDTTEGNTHG